MAERAPCPRWGTAGVRLGLIGAAAALFTTACVAEPVPPPARSGTAQVVQPRLTPAPNVPGDPENGRRLFTDTRIYASGGCAACHTLLSVPQASNVVGPNLTNVVLRPTIAGDTIPMTPDNLRSWIRDAPSMKPPPSGMMPSLAQNVTENDARDLAAFLYSQPYNSVR